LSPSYSSGSQIAHPIVAHAENFGMAQPRLLAHARPTSRIPALTFLETAATCRICHVNLFLNLI